jgi:hypothetical protein
MRTSFPHLSVNLGSVSNTGSEPGPFLDVLTPFQNVASSGNIAVTVLLVREDAHVDIETRATA